MQARARRASVSGTDEEAFAGISGLSSTGPLVVPSSCARAVTFDGYTLHREHGDGLGAV